MNLYVLVFVITSVLAMGLRQVQAHLMVEDKHWHSLSHPPCPWAGAGTRSGVGD